MSWTFSTGYYIMEVDNIAKCVQEVGSVNEPCPWTPNWANLFENKWIDSHYRHIDVLDGTTEEWRWYFDSSSDTEIWTKNVDGSTYERRLSWWVHEDKPEKHVGGTS